MRIMVVLGEGGHTKEMVTLVEMLGDEIEYGYIVADDDEVSESKITRRGPVFKVIRPRDKVHHIVGDSVKTLKCILQTAGALRSFRPHAILSAGPSIAVAASVAAKLMRLKVIFVETGSRITFLSVTGKIMYRLADLYFVQSEELAQEYDRAVYAGRLF